MSKIKILHIIKSLGRGGAEMLLPETLSLHNRDHFEFHYIYFLPWKNQMVGEIKAQGGTVTCFLAKNNIELILKQSEVVRYCDKNQIQLIHAHLPWSGFLARLIYKKTGIPVVYTEHNIQERYHKATKLLNKFSFNRQSMALGVSEDATRSIRENIKPQIPVQTLLNGVNTSKFKRDLQKGLAIRKKYNIPANAVVIGNIAVFREQKNLTAWIKAFKRISESRDAYGILVGAGPQEEQLKSHANEYGLEGRLVFPGLQTDTISFFSAMDIFMMSSSFEGLPIALLEGMSMECAIVSTAAGGVKEVIRNGQDGLICEVEDWEKLSDLCLSLMNDPEKLKTFQKAARERVVKNFSLKRMVEELEGIYGEIVKE
ncbi:glycosyl transferase family 1 [Christiangramia fulva]|uniref:Glycosyl transferase family 1 n=1 Tax=Christiangramia fulva TaxID=2126553 RepID=A0A2R3Z9D6_9FLAO|nr:glycosyltransferase [Christiangramia fulva]AVR46898.1 glycosyl transferase family 1 [Christiangramia fulva]